MKSLLTATVLFLLVSGCSGKNEQGTSQSEKGTSPKEQSVSSADAFTSELQELKEYFQIPGLAVSIEKNGANIYRNYFGVSDLEQSKEVDSTTLFPIASVTKVFSGVLLMKLVEQGKLSLEEPINTYVPQANLGDSILIKHVLSHTSQGKVGQTFYYSSRFGLLTPVIEQAGGKPFSEVMAEEILKPLELKNTFLLKDSTQIGSEKRQMAQPYMLNNGIEEGFIDYGYSASAGLVSNLEDLAVFNKSMDQNELITQESRELMFSSFGPGLPYGYGIFSQAFEGLDLVWAYGQYDCYSSLFLKIPSEELTLTLLANNSLLSDPARLIYGDATSSLFVLSFLKNYVYGLQEMALFEKPDQLSRDNSLIGTIAANEKGSTGAAFLRKKWLAEALAESYMARFDPGKLQSSAQLLEKVFSEFPDYLTYADLNLLHTLAFLKDVAFYMDLGEFNAFDTQLERIGQLLLQKEPDNPYAHIYMGTFHARKGNEDRARYHFEKIVNAKNFSKNWYTMEAQRWLDENR